MRRCNVPAFTEGSLGTALIVRAERPPYVDDPEGSGDLPRGGSVWWEDNIDVKKAVGGDRTAPGELK
jgi:hypothetical protein